MRQTITWNNRHTKIVIRMSHIGLIVDKKEMQMASAKSITKYPPMQAVEALHRQVDAQVNVPPPERLLSTVSGSALALSGLIVEVGLEPSVPC